MNKIRNAKNIPMISQIAACAAIENKEYMSHYVAEVISARKVFESELSNIQFNRFLKIFPSKANFILIRVFQNKKGELISFLESKNIFVRDVSLKTLTNDYIRITIGTRKQMLIVIENLKEFYFK